MKRRYLNGLPVYNPGEKVEVYDDTMKLWVPAVVEKRYPKAEIPSGRRSYEYGLGCVCGTVRVRVRADASFLRMPRPAPRVIRAGRVKP